jgi:hypothetical protein
MIRRTAFWLILFAAITGEASADQQLFRIDCNANGGASPMIAPQGIQFVIDFQSPVVPGHFEKFGRQAYWQDGAFGSYDFTSSNSPEFSDLVQILTNGIDNEISVLTYNDFYGGSGFIGNESAWGFGNPDLAGNQIDFIRLVVHDLTIQPYNPGPPFGGGLQWNGHITWEFWGTPLPEPASAFLLLCGSALFRRTPRPRPSDS